MAGEGTWIKSNGDYLYASEANKLARVPQFIQGGSFALTPSGTALQTAGSILITPGSFDATSPMFNMYHICASQPGATSSIKGIQVRVSGAGGPNNKGLMLSGNFGAGIGVAGDWLFHNSAGGAGGLSWIKGIGGQHDASNVTTNQNLMREVGNANPGSSFSIFFDHVHGETGSLTVAYSVWAFRGAVG